MYLFTTTETLKMIITCSELYYILPRGGDIIRLFYKTYIFNQLNLCGKAGENNSMPRLIVLKHPAKVTVITKLLATPLTLNGEKTSSTC